MELPNWMYLLFYSTTFLALILFAWAIKPAFRLKILSGILVWIALQGFLAIKGFYLVTDSIPPRFVFAVMPTFLFIFYIIFFKWDSIKNKFDAERLTYFHIVRIPVEIAIFSWYTYALVPKLMTFEGVNFDIFSGITAFFIGFGYFRKQWISDKVYIFWNYICLALLVNIVVQAIGSAQTPLQFQAFDQPNVAVMLFPFIWLPSFIVPAVLFAHLFCLKQGSKA